MVLNCWAESYCKGFPGKCDRYCIGYVQLSNVYHFSNMPKKYQRDIQMNLPNHDLDAYIYLRDYLEDVENRLARGKGVFLHSKSKGNGKTSWACKIMNMHFRNVALTNNLRCRGLFINVPEFLQDLRDAMDNPEKMEEMQGLIETIKTVELVIWDDIGTETPTKWVRERLYILINSRDSDELSNIYTSNLPLDSLVDETMLGERICDRIKGHAKLLEFRNDSRRDFEDD